MPSIFPWFCPQKKKSPVFERLVFAVRVRRRKPMPIFGINSGFGVVNANDGNPNGVLCYHKLQDVFALTQRQNAIAVFVRGVGFAVVDDVATLYYKTSTV